MPTVAVLEHVSPPTITPLRRGIEDIPESFISLETQIELHTSSPNCKVYFTTDGSEPDPSRNGSKKTFRYRQPFNLKPGQRTLRAIAISRTGPGQSAITTRTFIVKEGIVGSTFLDEGDGSQSIMSINSDFTHVLQGSDFANLPPHPRPRSHDQHMYDSRPPIYENSGYPGREPPMNGYAGRELPMNGYPGREPPMNGYPGREPPMNGYPGREPPMNGYPGREPPMNGYPHGEHSVNGFTASREHPLNGYVIDDNGFLVKHDGSEAEQDDNDYKSEVFNFFRKERHRNSQEAWVESKERSEQRSPTPTHGAEHSPGLYYGPERRPGTPSRVRFSEHEDRYSDDVDLESATTIAEGPAPLGLFERLPSVPVNASRELKDVERELAERHLDKCIDFVEQDRLEQEEHAKEIERAEEERQRRAELERDERRTMEQERQANQQRVMNWYCDRELSDDEETYVIESNGDVKRKKVKNKEKHQDKSKHKSRDKEKKSHHSRSPTRSKSPSHSRQKKGVDLDDIDSGQGHVTYRRPGSAKIMGISVGQGHVPHRKSLKEQQSKHQLYDDIESLELDLESLASSLSSSKQPDSAQSVPTVKSQEIPSSKQSLEYKSSNSSSSSSSSSDSETISDKSKENTSDLKHKSMKTNTQANRSGYHDYKKEEEQKKKHEAKIKDQRLRKEQEKLERQRLERKQRFEKREQEMKQLYQQVSKEREQKKSEKEKNKKEKSAVQPKVQNIPEPTNEKEGKLHFVNESGTQINIMGASSKSAVKKAQKQAENLMTPAVRPNIPSMSRKQKPAILEDEISPPSTPTVAEESETSLSTARGSEASASIDCFFETRDPRSTVMRSQHLGDVQEMADSGDEDSVAEASPPVVARTQKTAHSAPSDGAVTASKQAEQQSIGSFFKKIFKGWGSSEDEDDGKKKTVGRSGNEALPYEEIIKKCKSGKLWEDPDFPAESSSLYLTGSGKGRVEWKRPKDICKDPKMFVGGASRFDIKQGVLGNCWLLAAVASLAGDQEMLYKVVPPEQSFSKNYKGVFRFSFWQYGRWIEVCVDDRLPTKRGQLLYMHSNANNEFWSPLLEKAYAKLTGCYEAMSGGMTSEAMTDFTGGLCERFNFSEEVPSNMPQILLKARQRGSLMGCSIDATPDRMEAQLDNGLIIGHAYSITDVKQIDTKRGQIVLLRVRNPWGNEAEWTGAWSDGSDEWKSIPKKTRDALGLTFDHDGEFWMSMQDFCTYFQRVEICNVVPDKQTGHNKVWQTSVIKGAWIKKVNAGGCRNSPATYWTNPQYRITVTDPDEDDDEDICTVIVALMQKDRRKMKREGGQNLTMGYDIYQVDSRSGKTLEKNFFKKHSPVATSPSYINMREVSGRARLPPGQYCVVPTTFDADEEADFIIRFYSENASYVKEVDQPTSLVSAGTMSAAHSAPVQAAIDNDLAAQAEEEFKARAGEDLQLDAQELQEILNGTFTQDFDCGEFDINLCRSMVALRDLDHTGTLGLEEFRLLWQDLQQWRDVFREHDTDNSGHFSSYELREALKATGFQTSNATCTAIVRRYSDRDGFVQFDDFVSCIIKLKAMFDIFRQTKKDGKASYDVDEFIQMTIYT